MNKFFRNGLFMLAAGTLAVSCADYNSAAEDFAANPDPKFVEQYKDLAPIKSYINRSQYPNFSLGVTLRVSEYNKQELAHAAAVTNFDNVAFGTTLMPSAIVTSKGVMNFMDMSDLLDHAQEIGGDVYGSPIAANANQAEDWINMLMAPIEVPVEFVEDKRVNYNDSTAFNGTADSGKPSIETYDNQKTLKIPLGAKVRIVEGFDVDPSAKYTVTFLAKSDKDGSFNITFSGRKIGGTGPDGKWILKAGKWQKITVESAQAAEGETAGYLRIDNLRTSVVYIKEVEEGYFPDNHRVQTAQEIKDTVDYALNRWCNEMMKINKGRIKSFDLIDEAIDNKTLENGMFDLKHSKDKMFWQDIFGSENYAPEVSRLASEAFANHGGNPAELKFFISETGLDNPKKFESLMYWIDIWKKNGAKIDGINAKVDLSYSENTTQQAANEEALTNLLNKLKSTGMLIRLSNFDIRYKDASGVAVMAAKITPEQRQKLADYNAKVIKLYLSTIDIDKQAGICKSNMVDTTDPVGLWSVDTKSKDWVRTATYEAFCKALSGN